MIRLVVATIVSVLMSGCVSTRQYVPLDPSTAEADALRDIENGTVVIYYAGTWASVPLGVPMNLRHELRAFKKVDLGSGCVVDSGTVSPQQAEYAEIYNQTIVRYLSEDREESSQGSDDGIQANQRADPTSFSAYRSSGGRSQE